MNFLFDSSALMNIIEQKGKQSANLITEQYTLDLAFYELGNATWKNVHRNLISLEIATQIMGSIQSILQSMQIISYNLENQEQILKFAGQTDATFYDSAYLFTALKEKFVLVTDDEKMQKIAKNHKIPFKLSTELTI